MGHLCNPIKFFGIADPDQDHARILHPASSKVRVQTLEITALFWAFATKKLGKVKNFRYGLPLDFCVQGKITAERGRTAMENRFHNTNWWQKFQIFFTSLWPCKIDIEEKFDEYRLWRSVVIRIRDLRLISVPNLSESEPWSGFKQTIYWSAFLCFKDSQLEKTKKLSRFTSSKLGFTVSSWV